MDNSAPESPDWFTGLAVVVGSTLLQIQEKATEVALLIDEAIVPILPKIASALEAWYRLPEEVRPTIRALAERGWFFSGLMGISELRTFQAWIDAGESSRIDLYMQERIKTEFEEIRTTICDPFPARAQIISAALDAHLAGQYALSIPVLLIQAEGMCVDTFGIRLYSTKNGIPKTCAAAEALIDNPLADVFLLPMREPSGLTASEQTRASFPDAPNRHEILHGYDTSYPTKENSFKAISLLEYFVTLVSPRKGKNAKALPPVT